MVNNVEGLFEVDEQGTNRALIIESLHSATIYAE